MENSATLTPNSRASTAFKFKGKGRQNWSRYVLEFRVRKVDPKLQMWVLWI